MTPATASSRPILFTPAMAQKCHDGSKTQTRRVVKGIADADLFEAWPEEFGVAAGGFVHHAKCGSFCDYACGGREIACPYGKPGDRLWVRESLKLSENGLVYAADGTRVGACPEYDALYGREYLRPTIPNIHMPRWACRTVLEVVKERVERVQDISGADAIAEGFATQLDRSPDSARLRFLETFYDINKRAPRDSNPRVWVIEFKRVEVKP